MKYTISPLSMENVRSYFLSYFLSFFLSPTFSGLPPSIWSRGGQDLLDSVGQRTIRVPGVTWTTLHPPLRNKKTHTNRWVKLVFPSQLHCDICRKCHRECLVFVPGLTHDLQISRVHWEGHTVARETEKSLTLRWNVWWLAVLALFSAKTLFGLNWSMKWHKLCPSERRGRCIRPHSNRGDRICDHSRKFCDSFFFISYQNHSQIKDLFM